MATKSFRNEEVAALTQLSHGCVLRQCVQIAAAVQRELLALSVCLMLPGACCHCVTCYRRVSHANAYRWWPLPPFKRSPRLFSMQTKSGIQVQQCPPRDISFAAQLLLLIVAVLEVVLVCDFAHGHFKTRDTQDSKSETRASLHNDIAHGPCEQKVAVWSLRLGYCMKSRMPHHHEEGGGSERSEEVRDHEGAS